MSGLDEHNNGQWNDNNNLKLVLQANSNANNADSEKHRKIEMIQDKKK